MTYAQQMEALEHLLQEVGQSDEEKEIIYSAPGIITGTTYQFFRVVFSREHATQWTDLSSGWMVG